jgi:Tectonin domain
MADNWIQFEGLPRVKDIGGFVGPTNGSFAGRVAVGIDETLWAQVSSSWVQIASPGNLNRVTISREGTIWAIDSMGVLWKKQGDSWSIVDVFGKKVKDVGVSADGTVWLLMPNRQYYTISPGANPLWGAVFLGIDAIAGEAKPNEANPFGLSWAIENFELYRCIGPGFSPTNIRGVLDVSIGEDGLVWLLKTDKTIWTTRDGLVQLRSGTLNEVTRIANGCAVLSDGTAWARLNPNPSPNPNPFPDLPQGGSSSIGTKGEPQNSENIAR